MGTNLASEIGRIDGIREGGGPPRPFGKLMEKDLRVVSRVEKDLATEEAVLRGEIALDINEAEDAIWNLRRE